MAKYTKEDIKLIAKQMREKKDGKPFNLLTGAGISKTAGIPLARELVSEIHQKYGDECKRQLEQDQLDDYGWCMSCLSANERRKLIEGYIDNSKINWAHIAIASMMHAGFISRVITFNFDNVLARACGLLGLYPATYDFAAAATVNTDYISTSAIVHLHGQGSGRVLLNTNEETKKHTENIRPLIRTTLQDHSLLIVGYSGGSDAVLPLLCEEYTGREKIWWAGYSDNQSTDIDKLIQQDKNNANYIGGCDADEFLIRLARELNCFPPTLFKNPFEHLLEELKPLTDFPMTGNESVDLLNSTRHKLRIASDEEDKKKISLDELIMQGNWQAVIDSGDTTDAKQRDKVAWAYFMLANELSETARISKDENLFNEAFNKYQEAINLREKYYQAYNNWGISLASLAHLKNDVKVYEESLINFQKASDINPKIHEIYTNWGNALGSIATKKEDECIFNEAFNKFIKSLEIKPDNYEALFNWGTYLLEYAELKKDENLYKESIRKLEESLILKFEDRSYLKLCDSMLKLARFKSDSDLYSDVFKKYDLLVKRKPELTDAYIEWGVALVELAKIKKDTFLYVKSYEKFNKAIELNPQQYATYIFFGCALYAHAELAPEENLYLESYSKFEKAVSLCPRNLDLYLIYNTMGLILIARAKLSLDESLFEQGIDKYKHAVEINASSIEAYHNWGVALSELGKLRKDENIYLASFEQFEKALSIKSDDFELYENWSSVLLNAYTLFKKKIYIESAYEILVKAEQLEPNRVYNQACYYAQIQDYQSCKKKLETCKEHNTLPPKKHLLEDKDLENIRGEEWFKEFIKDLS